MVRISLKRKTLLSILLLLLTAVTVTAQSQNTIQLSLKEAEKLFVQNNYQLLVQQYQTDQARAEVITARLFDNPEISYENLLYNPETRRFLGTSWATGQYQASVSQLIRLAGKRNKNIQLAASGVKMAEYQYFDLMRSLRFNLSSTFYKTYYNQQSAKVYEQQINSLKLLLSANEQQLKLGNVALKDIIRIRSLLYTLQGEYSTLMNEIEDSQTELKMLTSLPANSDLLLLVSPEEEQNYQPDKQAYTNLLDSARNNRADLQLAKSGITYAENNLRLQKANAVPDVELSLSYDMKGSYPENYTGIGIKMPLPLFNRNQGELKKARIALEAGKTQLRQQDAQLENEVYNSYTSALRTENLYQGFDKNFNADFDKLIAEVIKNFKNRNISLIEFLDFYDSYKASTLQMNNLRYERMNAKEEINFVTGSNIFK
ncbi:TolC family protein [Pedobacter heparinus]|uniref:Outer membrane efflux protein n=1 Tax=Pedobacter heparinus (strain ATCC 13125 / DSM 2366 / CIP 104194 / JCM 7457 / NBRC 12017 / NCIMB 9290 / NRRL B-14731 / HIM 762-3) TaxID=485917 RepID=C6XSZ7_PEDHD|nr:TolC family protein [Pedobacter heparinus]ACU03558.1 outer membrane efflux protein [Pedobacter heparinus DSM 2366]